MPFGCRVTFRPAERSGPKFGPRSELGVFVGWYLLPGGIFKGDYLVIPFDSLVKKDTKLVVRRVKECDLAVGPVLYPLRNARDILADEDLLEATKRLQESEPVIEGELPLELEDGVFEGGKDPDPDLLDIEAAGEGTITPTGEEDAEAGPSSSARPPARAPRGSRIFIPRVGPPPPPKKKEIRDDMLIEFHPVNPKQKGTKIRELYEAYKVAKTVKEAIELGTNRKMIKYDVEKGHATLVDPPAVVVLALAATPMPLLEAWCAPDSELGVVGEKRGRQVIRYTREDDLLPSTIKRAAS